MDNIEVRGARTHNLKDIHPHHSTRQTDRDHRSIWLRVSLHLRLTPYMQRANAAMLSLSLRMRANSSL